MHAAILHYTQKKKKKKKGFCFLSPCQLILDNNTVADNQWRKKCAIMGRLKREDDEVIKSNLIINRLL